LILIGASKKRRRPLESDAPTSVRAGNCLSKAWTWVSVQDGLQDLSGWQLEIGQSEQKHGVAVAGAVGAQAGRGDHTPIAKTAIRMAIKFLKFRATLEQLQDHGSFSSST
jgi:hypothetical protein